MVLYCVWWLVLLRFVVLCHGDMLVTVVFASMWGLLVQIGWLWSV